jgi:hypothetical protein
MIWSNLRVRSAAEEIFRGDKKKGPGKFAAALPFSIEPARNPG